MTVLAATEWATNGELIRDVAELGYLRREWSTLDVTYGLGTFWQLWRPRKLVCHDLYTLDGVDFRRLPHRRSSFDVVVFDPPYKLVGKPSKKNAAMEERYGTDGEYLTWQERHELIKAGLAECHRVARRYVLLKCMDQVAWHRVRWQTREFAEHMETLGARHVDSLLMLGGGRAQAHGRSQTHARRNYSTLMVFER